MLNHTVTCDTCGRDLTSTSISRDWRISVSVESIPVEPGSVMDMMVHRPLPAGPYHFCGLPCLTRWASSNPEDAS